MTRAEIDAALALADADTAGPDFIASVRELVPQLARELLRIRALWAGLVQTDCLLERHRYGCDRPDCVEARAILAEKKTT